MQHSRRPLGLAHLSLLHCHPARLVQVAADAGFQAISLRLYPAAPGGAAYPMEPGSAAIRDLRARLDASGLEVSEIEFVSLTPTLDLASLLPLLAAGAELGASRLDVSGDDPDLQRLGDRFGALCDHAGGFGLGVDLEFMRWRVVADLDRAVRVVRHAARANGRILLDALHLCRSGGDADAVARLDPRLIGALQLSDAPAADPGEAGIIAEAREGRLLPGDGELPIAQVLAAAPSDIPLSVEVPLARGAGGIADEDRARRIFSTTRRWLASAAPRA